jgi:MFS family permease
MGQWSGNGLVSFYLIAILKGIGITDGETQNKINGGLQVYNYVTSIAGALLVNKFGRRKMLLISTSGMAAAFLVWTALSAVNEQKGYQASYGIGVVTMIFVFYLFYNVALNPVPVLYTMEVLPFTLRAKGLTLNGAAGMACGIFNGFVNPVALDAIGWKWYLVFLLLIVVWFFVVFIAFPETKDLSLEEISEVFEGPKACLPIFKHLGNGRGEDRPDV